MICHRTIRLPLRHLNDCTSQLYFGKLICEVIVHLISQDVCAKLFLSCCRALVTNSLGSLVCAHKSERAESSSWTDPGGSLPEAVKMLVKRNWTMPC